MTTVELQALLQQLYDEQAALLRSRWDRSISLADTLLANRWSRAQQLGFGEGVSLYDTTFVFGDVRIGAHSWVGPNVILDGTGGGLTIGAYCSISAGVHLYTHDTVLWAISGGLAQRREGAIAVGDCCHIGAQSIILPSVRIGRRCVVAANSLVNRDVADDCVVAGNPAGVIGRVEGEGADARIVITTASEVSSPLMHR